MLGNDDVLDEDLNEELVVDLSEIHHQFHKLSYSLAIGTSFLSFLGLLNLFFYAKFLWQDLSNLLNRPMIQQLFMLYLPSTLLILFLYRIILLWKKSIQLRRYVQQPNFNRLDQVLKLQTQYWKFYFINILLLILCGLLLLFA